MQGTTLKIQIHVGSKRKTSHNLTKKKNSLFVAYAGLTFKS